MLLFIDRGLGERVPQPAPVSGACLNPMALPWPPQASISHLLAQSPGSSSGRARGGTPRAGPSAPVKDREEVLSRLPVGILRLHPRIRRQRGDPSTPPAPPTLGPAHHSPRSLSRDTARLPRPHSPNPAPPAAPCSSPTLSLRSLAPSPPAAAPADSRSRWPGAEGIGALSVPTPSPREAWDPTCNPRCPRVREEGLGHRGQATCPGSEPGSAQEPRG